MITLLLDRVAERVVLQFAGLTHREEPRDLSHRVTIHKQPTRQPCLTLNQTRHWLKPDPYKCLKRWVIRKISMMYSVHGKLYFEAHSSKWDSNAVTELKQSGQYMFTCSSWIVNGRVVLPIVVRLRPTVEWAFGLQTGAGEAKSWSSPDWTYMSNVMIGWKRHIYRLSGSWWSSWWLRRQFLVSFWAVRVLYSPNPPASYFPIGDRFARPCPFEWRCRRLTTLYTPLSYAAESSTFDSAPGTDSYSTSPLDTFHRAKVYYEFLSPPGSVSFAFYENVRDICHTWEKLNLIERWPAAYWRGCLAF